MRDSLASSSPRLTGHELNRRRDLLDSWRQVAETLLSQTPSELLPASSKQQILLQLLQTLLNKVGSESLVSGMDTIVSSTVLLLAYTGRNLRYFHVRRNAIILKCDWPRSPVSCFLLEDS